MGGRRGEEARLGTLSTTSQPWKTLWPSPANEPMQALAYKTPASRRPSPTTSVVSAVNRRPSLRPMPGASRFMAFLRLGPATAIASTTSATSTSTPPSTSTCKTPPPPPSHANHGASSPASETRAKPSGRVCSSKTRPSLSGPR